MPNIDPLYSLTPVAGTIGITTTSAQVKSDGTCAASGTDLMFWALTAGANGSYIDRVRFFSVANSAATTGVATTLRVYLTTVASGATTNSNTFLLGEISVPAVNSSHSTNATNYYDVVLQFPIPSGTYITVSQHQAQTTNQRWNAMVIGGSY